jgi:hypothetical protein
MLNGSGQLKLAAFVAMVVQFAIVYYSFKSVFVLLWESNNLVGVSVSSLSDIVERRDVLRALLEVKFKVSRHHFDDALSNFVITERPRIGWVRWLTGRLVHEEVLLVLRRLEAQGHVLSVDDETNDPQDTLKACCSSLLNERARAAMLCAWCSCNRSRRFHGARDSASVMATSVPDFSAVPSVRNEAAFTAAWRTVSVEPIASK